MPKGVDKNSSVLDQLGLDPQATAELKLKVQIHQGILGIIHKHRYSARDLERILGVQQPRVSELLNGKLSTMGVGKLLVYLDLLNGMAEVRVKEKRAA